MMNTYVINMSKDTHRLASFKKSAALYDINFIRVDGVSIDDNSIKKSPDISNFMKKYGTKGMIGCFLAHKKVWEIIVNNKIKYAIILEDDIEFTEQFNPTIKEIQKDIKTLDFDILLLSSLIGCKNPKNYNFSDKVSKFFFKTREYKYINEKYHIPEFFGGLQSYIITYKSAKKLLKELSIVTYHVDLVISASQSIKIMSLNHPIIINSLENCDLSNNSTSYFLLDRYFKNIFIDGKNLSWMLNVSLMKVPVPDSQNPTIINPRFIIKYFLILIIALICIYFKIKQKYWILILVLFIIILLL
jgi:GR25 family glycosyltransferase involved in LPS biosynthesis